MAHACSTRPVSSRAAETPLFHAMCDLKHHTQAIPPPTRLPVVEQDDPDGVEQQRDPKAMVKKIALRR